MRRPICSWFAIVLSALPAITSRAADAPALKLENAFLSVSIDAGTYALTVTDKRTDRTWSQAPVPSDRALPTFRLEKDAPELLVSINVAGELSRPLPFPGPFVSGKGSYLVVPMNEGISYPVDDESIKEMRLIAYGGHGICMGFFGATDGQAGYMAILETSDDASIRIRRVNNLLCIAPEWDPQKGQFGYQRRIRYIFFDKGGHVAMANRYRAYAEKIGLVKTFTRKRKEIPAIDLLIGAANIWCWDRDCVSIVKQLKEAGIDRILWSSGGSAENIKALNEIPGVLTSRYDIYQDAMDPANFKFLRGVHPDWTTEAWPKDLMLNAKGEWIRGWAVRGKDGQTWYNCGVLCDKQAPAYAQKRIPAELAGKPYRCRFIDTTTASPWRECYSLDHPCTRTESRKYKMDLLALVGGKYKLVCGCETGHEAAVPYVDYFEGMLSLGPYRVPDSGRDMQRIWTEVPEVIAKFQLNEKYRLPLWELVFHDCVVAQWYWGDYNNKLPAVWDRRDLFNALYGTPPMFMFNRQLWQQNRDRFVQSYKATAPIARATGYSRMVDHRFLTADRSVQETRFGNGVRVVANFSDAAYRLDGTEVAPKSCRATGVEGASRSQ